MSGWVRARNVQRVKRESGLAELMLPARQPQVMGELAAIEFAAIEAKLKANKAHATSRCVHSRGSKHWGSTRRCRCGGSCFIRGRHRAATDRR